MSFDSNSAPEGACKSDCASIDAVMDRIRSNIERFSPFEGPGREDFRIYDVSTEPILVGDKDDPVNSKMPTVMPKLRNADALRRCRMSTDGLGILNLDIEPEVIDLNEKVYSREEIEKICNETGNLNVHYNPDPIGPQYCSNMSIDDIDKAVRAMSSTPKTSLITNKKALSGWDIAWNYNDSDVFKLAGVKHNKYEKAVLGDFRLSLLKYVASKELPKNIVLGFIDNKLSVNGIPTKITSSSIEMAFCGLTDLIGEKKARKFVGDRIRRKLKRIF